MWYTSASAERGVRLAGRRTTVPRSISKRDRRHGQRSVVTALVMALAAFLPPVAGAQVTLVVEGEPRAVVVTADAPTRTAAYAVEELVEHVRLATGVTLRVIPESETPRDVNTRIYVGGDGIRSPPGDRRGAPPQGDLRHALRGQRPLHPRAGERRRSPGAGQSGRGHPLRRLRVPGGIRGRALAVARRSGHLRARDEDDRSAGGEADGTTGPPLPLHEDSSP